MLDKETIFSISGHATHDPLDILACLGVQIIPLGCEEERDMHVDFTVDDSDNFEYIPDTKEFSAAISFPAEFEENTKFELFDIYTDSEPKGFKLCVDKFEVYNGDIDADCDYPSKIKLRKWSNKKISHKCLILKKSK